MLTVARPGSWARSSAPLIYNDRNHEQLDYRRDGFSQASIGKDFPAVNTNEKLIVSYLQTE